MNARQALNYGKGEYTLPSDTADLNGTEGQLRDWLDGFLAKPGIELPRPPAVALEILALSNKPTSSIDDVAAVLEREPLLAGQALRLANSALYGGASPCVTLKQSLVRMGLSLVRNVVMEAAMRMTVIHAEGFNGTLESVRRHSSAVAWISRFVARHTALDAENAFLVGLLHDVGLSVSLIGVSEFLRKSRQPLKLKVESWVAASSVHERFSETVLKSWGLPPTVTLAVGHHHTLVVDGHPHPQVAVLIVAEQIATDMGWGLSPVLDLSESSAGLMLEGERATSNITDRALGTLSLTRRHFETISADMKRVLTTLEGQFNRK